MRSSRFARAAAFAGFGLLLSAGPATGQDRTGTVEISPFGGAYFGGRLYRGSNDIFTRDVDVKEAGTYGLRIGVNVNRWLGLEAGVSRAEADIRDRDSGGGLFSGHAKVGELEVEHYEMNGLFNFGRRRVIPYVTVGAGATHFKAKVPTFPSDTDTRFTANLGIGVKVFFNPHVAVRFDGRGRGAYVNDSNRCHKDDNNDFCDDNFRDDNDRDRRRWYGSGELTGGLTFAF